MMGFYPLARARGSACRRGYGTRRDARLSPDGGLKRVICTTRDQCRTHASDRRPRGTFPVLGCVVLGFCESTKKGGRAEKSSHSACVPAGHCFGNGGFCAGLGVRSPRGF